RPHPSSSASRLPPRARLLCVSSFRRSGRRLVRAVREMIAVDATRRVLAARTLPHDERPILVGWARDLVDAHERLTARAIQTARSMVRVPAVLGVELRLLLRAVIVPAPFALVFVRER